MGKFPGGHLSEMQSFWQWGWGKVVGRGVALFAGLCSNLTEMAAKGDARDLLSSSVLPAACQGHGQREAEMEKRKGRESE